MARSTGSCPTCLTGTISHSYHPASQVTKQTGSDVHVDHPPRLCQWRCPQAGQRGRLREAAQSLGALDGIGSLGCPAPLSSRGLDARTHKHHILKGTLVTSKLRHSPPLSLSSAIPSCLQAEKHSTGMGREVGG